MGIISTAGTRFSDAVYAARLRRVTAEAAARGIGALLVTPSADYEYLLGYRAPALERLTCLILPVKGTPALVLPRLEEPLARHSMGDLADGLEMVAWGEADDPFELVGARLAGALRVGLQDQMWSRFVLRLRALLDPAELVDAGPAINAVRRIKQPEEVERLRAAATAADTAMRGITAERLSGRTEAEVSRRIHELLLEAGHDTADFAIVASGPNSASPHHEPGERVIEPGDAVVLDIGGVRAGYCSDTSRTAFVGEPPPDFAAMYEVLAAGPRSRVRGGRPGRSGGRRGPPRGGSSRRGVRRRHPASHRARDRDGDARGAVHRRRQRRAAAARTRVQRGAGDLRRRDQWGAVDRGHRGSH